MVIESNGKLSQCALAFVQKLLRDKNKKLVVSFNLTYRHIDDVLSINNHNFHNYVHLICNESGFNQSYFAYVIASCSPYEFELDQSMF